MSKESPKPDELIEQLEDITDWDIDDWEYTVDSDGAEFDVTLNHDPKPDPNNVSELVSEHDVKEIIEDIAEHSDTGAQSDDVIEAVWERETGNIHAAEIADIIDGLKQRGELYEPRTGYLRVT